MRLTHYLTEGTNIIYEKYSEENFNKAIYSIQKDCQQYLKLVKSSKKIASRYQPGFVDKFFVKGYTRKDRTPTDMSIEDQTKFDKLFKKKFGWKVRSEGAYTYIKSIFKKPNESYFFPIDKFDYIWSPIVNDLFGDYDPDVVDPDDESTFEYNYEKLVNSYQMNKGFNNVKNQEVIWKCKSYYILSVDKNYKIIIQELLNI